MADLRVQRLFGYDNAGALDVVVNEAGVQPRAMVDVIEAVRKVRGDLHAREPGGEDREIRVIRIPETTSEVRTFNEFVHEVNVIPRQRRAKEPDYAAVVAPTDSQDMAS